MSGPSTEHGTTDPILTPRPVAEHPRWCDPDWCGAGTGTGLHHSRVIRYGPDDAYAAWLQGGTRGVPGVMLIALGRGYRRDLDADAVAAAMPRVLPQLLAMAGVEVPDPADG